MSLSLSTSNPPRPRREREDAEGGTYGHLRGLKAFKYDKIISFVYLIIIFFDFGFCEGRRSGPIVETQNFAKVPVGRAHDPLP